MAEAAYAGNGTDTLRKWSGSAWSAPTASVKAVGESTFTAARAMPKAGAICVMPTNNRLVATGFATTTGAPHGATSSPSHVYFSQPGDPEKWDNNEFEQLTPGDGEKIMSAIAWQDFVFVFKESRFFRFNGESFNPDGVASFDYIPIEANAGLVSRRALTAGRDGVYFLDRKGLYRTTGGVPTLLSSLLDPLFYGTPPPYWLRGAINQSQITQASLAWHEEQIYLSVPLKDSTTADAIFVFDPRYGWWSFYRIGASCVAPWRAGSSAELFFGYATGGNHIGRYGQSFVTDGATSELWGDGSGDDVWGAGTDIDDVWAAGADINGYWRGAWDSYGSPNKKTWKEARLWGSGKVSMGVATDFDLVAPAYREVNFITVELWSDSSGDVWGDGTGTDVWPAEQVLSSKLYPRAHRGTWFAPIFESKDGSDFEIHSLSARIESPERPSRTRKDR